MASIKILLREDKLDQSGEAPLFLRIIKDRKTKFMTLGIKLKPSEWDNEKFKVKKNHSNSARLNAFISQKVADAEGEVADMMRKRKDVTTKKLKQAILGKAPENYFEYVFGRLDKIKPNIKFGVWKNYESNTIKLEQFNGSRELFFDDITVTFLKDFQDWMINTKKNNPTTVAYALKVMRKFYREAIREDIAKSSSYPFDKIKTTFPAPQKHYLSKEQVDTIAGLEMKTSTKEGVYRDMFLFACYGGGLRFADVVELTWENLKEDEQRIVKVIRKTGRGHNIKLPQVAFDILMKYKTPDAVQADYIFPVLPSNEEYKGTGEFHYFTKSKVLKNANNTIHSIGKKLKLSYQLTFHASRHTFATQALNNGMRIEFVSKLMDHCNIGITQVYAKIIDKELDNAMMEAFK